ncbi:MAG: hypothetical protein HQM16_13220 [Deltaproteobacteria bacterium]|nr:hypothetical protein [Deltaproteobacteria bacterium]
MYFILIMSLQAKTENDCLFTASGLQRVLKYDLSAVFKALKSFENSNIITAIKPSSSDKRATYYILSEENPFFGSFARLSDKKTKERATLPERCYINWGELYKIAKSIDSLIAYDEGIINKNNQTGFSIIIKDKLALLLNDLYGLERSASIPLDLKKSKSKVNALEDIKIVELTKYIEDSLKGVILFLSN